MSTAMRITFDRSLYLPEAVEAAAAAYAKHAKVVLHTDGEAVSAEISDTGDLDVDTVTHSFANHALFETITRMRHASIEGA